MQSLIEQFLQVFLKNLYGEGQRRLKIKALSAGLRTLSGIRKLVLLQYALMISCFLCAAGLLGSTWLVVQQLSLSESFVFTLQLKFTLGLTAITGVVLYYTVRERTWINAMNLEHHIEALTALPSATQSSEQAMSREELSLVIGQMLDEKLSVLASEIAKGKAASDVTPLPTSPRSTG